MAKQITELDTAGAVTGASDLLWLEQAGIPKKITVANLGAGTVGTVTNAMLRWSGTAWVENTVTKLSSTGKLDVGSTALGLSLAVIGGTGGADIASFRRDPGGSADTVVGIGGGGGLPFIQMSRDSGSAQWAFGVGTGSNYVIAQDTDTSDAANYRWVIDSSGDVQQDGKLTLGSGDSADGDILIDFDIDRGWSFRAIGVDSTTKLQLRSGVDKDFQIADSVGAVQHTFNTGAGNYTAVGVVTAAYYEATDLGPNSDPGTDDVYLGGYGLMGNRSSLYITNQLSTGEIVLGNNGNHNGNRIAVFSEHGQTLVGTSASIAALQVSNVGTTNIIASFIGDTDALEVATVSAGDYTIRNNQQNNGIIFYDGTGGVDLVYNSIIMLSVDSGLDVTLMQNGNEEAWTQDHNASGNTSGFACNDYGGTKRDVGFATMETITFTANTVVAADHWSQKCLEHTNATTHTLTFNTLSTVPNGAVMWVKATTGIVTLVDGSMVLSFYDGSSVTTGNISVAIGGWATIHKTGNSTADVTGAGLT